MSADQFQFTTFARDDTVNGTWYVERETDEAPADDKGLASPEAIAACYDTSADGFVSPIDALLFTGEDLLF